MNVRLLADDANNALRHLKECKRLGDQLSFKFVYHDGRYEANEYLKLESHSAGDGGITGFVSKGPGAAQKFQVQINEDGHVAFNTTFIGKAMIFLQKYVQLLSDFILMITVNKSTFFSS